MKTFDQKVVNSIVQKYQLRLLLLFGSQVSGKTHKHSDYDFAFLSRKEINFGDRASLRDDLAALIDFKSEVEEIDLKEATPFLLKQILNNYVVIYSAGSAYEEFYSFAFRTCLESQRLFYLQDELYRKRIDKYRTMYVEQGSS